MTDQHAVDGAVAGAAGDTRTGPARWAIASRRGVRAANMDAGAVFEAASGVRAAVVVDGIGNDTGGAAVIGLLAQAAVRIGVTRGPLAGVLAAAALIEDPGAGGYHPDGVAVLVVARPGEPVELAWVGDSHAYSWTSSHTEGQTESRTAGRSGGRLVRRTTPQTMGAYLRANGEPETVAVLHDNWVRVSLATATVTSVALAEIPAGELVVLVSDGADAVPHHQLEALAGQLHDDPQALAEAIVAAVPDTDADGYRDDTTAVVVLAALNAENRYPEGDT